MFENRGELQRGDRGGLGGLENDGVSGGQRGCDFPREHQQREIPRDDLADHAERLERAAGGDELEFVRPAGVVEEMRGGHRQVEVARLLDRLAAVEGFRHGELAGAVLEQAGDAEEILASLLARQHRPGGEGLGGGGVGGIDIGGVGEGDLAELGPVARGDGVEVFLRLRRGELAVDEQSVARRDEGLGRLRGGVEFPEVAEQEFARSGGGFFGGHFLEKLKSEMLKR